MRGSRLPLRAILLTLLAAPVLGLAQSETPANEAQVRELFADFPRAYWYAGDAWLKAMKKGGNFDDPVTAAKELKIKGFKLETEGGKTTLKFGLAMDGDKENYHGFMFVHENGRWKTTHGWVMRGEVRMDLYTSDLFSISQKPFVQAEVDKMVKKEGIYAADFKRAPKTEPPKYATLIGEGLAGSGFHLEWKGKRFLVSSLHQFESKTPKEFLSLDSKQIIPVTKQVQRQFDVQVLAYDSEWLDQQPALKYTADTKLEVGDPVFVLTDGERLLAHVVATTDSNLKLQMAKPFPAGGASGSPIVSGNSGDVVAVLLSADSPLEAEVVGAEMLKLSPKILEEIVADSAPADIFGVPVQTQPEAELASQVLKESIPPGVFQVRFDLSPADLLKLRPESSKELDDAYRGKNSYESFQPYYLASSAEYLFAQGKLTRIGLDGGRAVKAEEVGRILAFFTAYFGAPALGYERDSDKRLPGTDTVGVYWTNDQFSAVLCFSFRDPKETSLYLRFAKGKQPLNELTSVSGATALEVKPDKLVNAVTEWVRMKLDQTEAK